MPDKNFGVTKVSGHVGGGESLTLTMDFWTVTTAVNILTANDTNGGTPASQAALDKLVEVISQRGQPVILAAPTVLNGVYTLKFAIEHAGSWAVTAGAAPGADLVAAIKRDGVNYGFATDTTITATPASHL